jgi:putative membrane protein
MRLIIRWIVVALALAAAVWLVPGIHVEGTSGIVAVAVMAIVLGFVNAFFRPFLAFLSCAFIILTMGLGMFVVNAISFWAAAWISTNWFNAGFYIDNFWAALLGSVVVSVISFILSLFLADMENKRDVKQSLSGNRKI